MVDEKKKVPTLKNMQTPVPPPPSVAPKASPGLYIKRNAPSDSIFSRDGEAAKQLAEDAEAWESKLFFQNKAITCINECLSNLNKSQSKHSRAVELVTILLEEEFKTWAE